MLYLVGEILLYLIIATSLGLLAGWAVTWTSTRQKLVAISKKFQIQLNDRSHAVKQLKENLQEKIKEVEDLEYELMRRTVDRPEKLIGQGGTDRVRAYEDSINDALDQRDQRIAELEAMLKEQEQGDIIIDVNNNSDTQKFNEELQQRDALIAKLQAQLAEKPATAVVTEAAEDIIDIVEEAAPVEKSQSPMRRLEMELKSCLNEKKQHGETPELRAKIDEIKAAILEELKSKRES